jgi:AraC-like DNA-binding protein
LREPNPDSAQRQTKRHHRCERSPVEEHYRRRQRNVAGLLTYREHTPAPALAALVRCYWTVRGVTPSADLPLNRVLPDGCLDVIFDLADNPDADQPAGERAYVVGAMLEAEVFRHAGAMDMVGVRFAPGAAPLFLRTPAHELTATVATASAIWSDAPDVLAQLRETPALSDRLRLLDEYLLARLDAQDKAGLALRGMNAIERSRGLISLTALRAELATGERTLQRRFEDWVGLTPKQALRIARFRHALSLLFAKPRHTLARIAAICGYSDQAHLTNEFQALARITPRAYAQERGLVGFLQDAATEADYFPGEPLNRSEAHEDESPDTRPDG